MEILDRLNDVAKVVVDKTTEALETTRLNAKIASERSSIAEKYKQLGEVYYKKHRGGMILEPEAMEICDVIDVHNKTIEDAKEEIRKMHEANGGGQGTEAAAADGELVCPKCGKNNDPSMKYCTECGAKMAVNVEPEKEPAVSGVCPSCGVEVAEEMKYCGVCGRKLGE